jgi:hypothetical protein
MPKEIPCRAMGLGSENGMEFGFSADIRRQAGKLDVQWENLTP